MAVWRDSVRFNEGKPIVSYLMDSNADLANLPPLGKNVSAGSDAFSVAEKQLFMLGSDGVWR